MEMVLELEIVCRVMEAKHGFNPSSNGNGAGIPHMSQYASFSGFSFNPSSNGNGAGIRLNVLSLISLDRSFNPSSNGNGAGIFKYPKNALFWSLVSILLLMEMVLE